VAFSFVDKFPPKEVVKYTRIHSHRNHTTIHLGLLSAESAKILSVFKWSGRRLEHAFADGSSTALHQRKRTLLEAPTGTLLFYYKDIKQQIVHTLLLEEDSGSKKCVIIMDRRLAFNATSTQAGKSGPSAQDCYCARAFGGGAKKRHGNEEK